MASKPNPSLVIASVLSLLFLCGSAWGADSNGLISHWEFDEGAGTVAYDSAGENDGTIYGATWISGQIGSALSFDGDDYVDIGCQLIEEVENSFTAMAWFKLTAGFDQNLPHTILWQSGILGLRAYKRGPITADCLISGGWVTLSSGVTPVADTWYFVAETYDAEDDILKVYVNGDEKNSILCVPLKRSEHSLLLGVQAGEPPGNYMDGAIDDVRIYDRALSAEEVWELYRAGWGGLIAHWEFDEGEGTTTYDSAGDNDGILNGDPEWVAGQIGDYALDFDGDGDCVDFGDIDEFEFGDANFTIAAWFYTQGPHSAYGGYGDVVSKYNYGGDDRQWVIYQDPDGRIDFYTNPTGQWATDEHLWSDDGYQSRWTHIVAVRDGSTKILYIDGAPENTGATAGVVTGKSSKVYVGCRENPLGRGYFFNGMIDDVRVYNQALSAEEAWELYQEGGGGLIAHWEFDEGEGSTAYDSAGDNDGAIYGATWISGQIGGGLSFDGDDYVDVGLPERLDFERTDAYTLSAWHVGDGIDYALLSKMDRASNYRGYDIFVAGGYVQAHLINKWMSNALRETGTLYPVNDLAWHHIAVTYDGSSSPDGLKIYVDGMEETTVVGPHSLSSTIQNSVSFKIAARSEGEEAIHHLTGEVDDVRIYNRALSAEEIQELYDYGMFDPYLLAKRSIQRALERKIASLEELEAALAEETGALEALNELLESGDYGDLSRRDVLRAKWKIRCAMWREKLCRAGLKRTIRKLEGSLALLGGEVQPQSWEPQTEVDDAVIRADINQDGVVNFGDFAILTEHWLKSY